jgi:hypothetical protein
MFGNPCLLPEGASVFRWVWLYKITMEDSIRKKAWLVPFVMVLPVEVQLQSPVTPMPLLLT